MNPIRIQRTIAVGSLLLAAVVCASVSGAADLARVDRSEAPESPFARVAREAGGSVVSILAERNVTRGGMDLDPMEQLYRRYFPGEEGSAGPFGGPGSGTGFVVSDQGHVLTNDHVVARADRVFVRFSGDERPVEAEVVGTDPASDLALLRVELPDGVDPLTFGDSDLARVGDWTVAVGNPFGNLAGSVTVGVVSAKGRNDLAIHGGAPRYQDFLQTDAAINFGNSGGPLLDIAGRVVGVNTAVNRAGQGIGFAIPANYARRIFEQLAVHGRVIRGWMGADAGDHRIAGRRAGAMLETLIDDGPAAVAGLRAGDVVVRFGGEPVADARDLHFLVSEAEPGREIPVRCIREGQEIDATVVPVEEPADGQDRPREAAWLGMSTASLGGDDPRVARLREAFGIDAERGVMVVDVRPESPAAKAGLSPGDVILAVDDRPVEDEESFLALRDDMGSSPSSVTLLVESGGLKSYLRIDVDPGS